ncbi:MAG: asparagine synthase (glutamine-hydrolyzing) [Bacteroidia bacterium]
MCGISGFFSGDQFFSREDLEGLVRSQHHRGPDSNGIFLDHTVGLGHNRLKIIDLSERGSQPMHSGDGRYVMIYNGEVYNYSEISADLKYKKGDHFQFRSASDTEVILEAFVHYGADFVQLLNGMFAIVIYDKELGELHLFRDRIGIKPVYYYWDGDHFAFSSEIRALKQMSKLNLKINYTCIPQYLHLGYIPAPFTIYENCYKLEAGHHLKIGKNCFEKKPYWSLGGAVKDKVIKDERNAGIMISDLISSAVQYQLKSDVPYGIFLSGGIDSSLVTANAVKMAGTRINTFSIGFEDQQYNEAFYAKRIADHLGTNHHEFIVTIDEAISTLDDYMQAYGEPFADSSGIPTLLISKLARKYVTVALSGEGGDELFHGYGAYKWAGRLDNYFIYQNRHFISRMLKRSGSDRNKRVGDMFLIDDKARIRSHIFTQEQYFFSADEISGLFALNMLSADLLDHLLGYSDTAFSNSLADITGKRELNPAEKQALYDLQFYLPDNLLVKVDRASMHHSLEIRVPFLDHRLVEESLNISAGLKINGVSKYILKEILYQYIPKSYFERPKQGFSIPLKHWLKKEMRFLIEDYLNPANIKQVGLVDASYVSELVKRFFGGEDYLFQRLWLLINLHMWMRTNA